MLEFAVRLAHHTEQQLGTHEKHSVQGLDCVADVRQRLVLTRRGL